MSWRIHENHKDETRAVKNALKSAGVKASVKHGSGTSWAWLHIKLANRIKTESDVLNLIQKVTGRHGDYEGEILITIDNDKIGGAS